MDRPYRSLTQHTGLMVFEDSKLFHALEENRGPEAAFLWECPTPVVLLGASGKVSDEVHEECCIRDGIPIQRRITGGGAVILGTGCLNYSFVLSLDRRPELRGVGQSYRIILGRIVAAIHVPGLAIRGTSDIAIGDRKVSGNAQRRGRRALLHHGTILYSFDIRLMERYLKFPERQPAYRRGRSHSDFITNLQVDPDAIKEAIVKAWQW